MCPWPWVTRGEEPGAKVGSVDQLIFGLIGFVRTFYFLPLPSTERSKCPLPMASVWGHKKCNGFQALPFAQLSGVSDRHCIARGSPPLGVNVRSIGARP